MSNTHFVKRALFALLFVTVLPTGPALAEKRCGWLANPTPGNWHLADRDGLWVLAQQMRDPVPGFDDLPDLSQGWGKNGRPARYGCACIEMDVDRTSQRVLRVQSGRQRPLSVCSEDPALRTVRPG